MNVTHMNEGHKVAYSLDGSILTIGESVVLNLDEEQEDVARAVSIFAGDDGTLSQDGHNYAATIILPPRRYADEEVDEIIDGEEVVQIVPVAQPLQVAAVTLQLWSIGTAHAESENEE